MALPTVSQYLDASTSGGPAKFSFVELTGTLYRSVASGLTALAGGGAAGATPLTADLNQVSTVATAADSAKLPASTAGMSIVVSNAAAANSMNVFPATGEFINDLAVNTALAVAANKTATFHCIVAGTWNSILTA